MLRIEGRFTACLSGLAWPRGERELLLVSVGTGYRPPTFAPGEAGRTTLVGWAGHAVETLMEDANVQQNLLLRLISGRGHRDPLAAETAGLGAPTAESVAPALPRPLLAYQRYTVSLARPRFDELGLPKEIDPADLASLDSADRVRELALLGRAVAAEQVSEEDFEPFL